MPARCAPSRAQEPSPAKTLDAVKARGQLVCGVNTGPGGFSIADSQGKLDRARRRLLPRRRRRGARRRQQGEVRAAQLAAALHVAAVGRDRRPVAQHHLDPDARRLARLVFTGINYYDGQGFMVPKKLKIDSAKQLNGATVCVQAGTTSEKNVADYFGANDMKYKPVVFDNLPKRSRARSSPAAARSTRPTCRISPAARTKDAQKPDDYVILPEVISKEPLGPSVGAATTNGSRSSSWTVFALIEAEENGSPRPTSTSRRRPTRIPASSASSASSRGHRQAPRPRRGVGLSDRQAGRQLRRDLRAQPRPEDAARAAARRQQSVDQGRPDVRAADPLKANGAAADHRSGPFFAATRTSGDPTSMPQRTTLSPARSTRRTFYDRDVQAVFWQIVVLADRDRRRLPFSSATR